MIHVRIDNILSDKFVVLKFWTKLKFEFLYLDNNNQHTWFTELWNKTCQKHQWASETAPYW